MKKFIKTAGLAVAFAAMAVSSASATTGPGMLKSASPIGTASNTGAISGNASSYPGHVFSAAGGAVKVQCADATFNITSVTTNTTTFDASYSGGCTFAVSGTVLGTAAVDTTTPWSLLGHSSAFSDATGAASGISVNNSFTKVTVAAIGCTLDVFGQTKAGITTQNIDASGANSTAAAPWGSKIVANVTGLTYTSTGTCTGLPEHGSDGGYVGTVAVKNVWGSL